jgi:hypothetical protein
MAAWFGRSWVLMIPVGNNLSASIAFSSEVGPARAKKTRQNKSLEPQFCFNQNRTPGAAGTKVQIGSAGSA